MEILNELVKQSIDNESIFYPTIFKHDNIYYIYLILTLQESLKIKNENMSIVLMDKLTKLSTIDVFSFLINLRDISNELMFIIFKLSLTKITVDQLRLIKDAQKLVHRLTLDQRHETIGYELFEMKNYKEDQLYIKSNKLNSLLINTDSYTGYYDNSIKDLNKVYNKENDEWAYILSEYDKNENEPSILMYMYLRELPDYIDNDILTYEFYRYLDSKEKDYMLKFVLIFDEDTKLFPDSSVIMGYYIYLYNNNRLMLNYICDIIKEEAEKDSRKYNIYQLEGVVEYMFKDMVIKGSGANNMKIFNEIKEYFGGEKYNTLSDVSGIIATYGNEEWIKAAVNSDYDLINHLNNINYKNIIKAYEEKGYNKVKLLTQGDYRFYHHYRDFYSHSANLVAKTLSKEEMKELVRVYKYNEGNSDFRMWFEEVILNQV